jgi:RNA polymerase sigma factor (TIGR02999 family)
MSDVTRILSQIEQGDLQAAEKLLPLVYDELRKLAAAKLAQEKPGQTLQATALVHEAYVQLVDIDRVRRWDSRGHFFGAAAEAMRQILVANARRKKAAKHGGDLRRADVDLSGLVGELDDEKLIAVDEALESLAEQDPNKAELVKLRFFVGLSIKEAAELLGISTATADRHWAYARAWLQQHVSANSR